MEAHISQHSWGEQLSQGLDRVLAEEVCVRSHKPPSGMVLEASWSNFLSSSLLMLWREAAKPRWSSLVLWITTWRREDEGSFPCLTELCIRGIQSFILLVGWDFCCSIQHCSLWEIVMESGYNQCLLSNPTAAIEEVDRVSSPWWGDIWAETWLTWGLEPCTYQGKERLGSRSVLLGTGNYQGGHVWLGQGEQWGGKRCGMKAGGTDHVGPLRLC